ncbi:hypothetical protein MHYP_G00340650 [Metynnis hypsauchen]
MLAFEKAVQEELVLEHFLSMLLPAELRWHVQLITPASPQATAIEVERTELILGVQCYVSEELGEETNCGAAPKGCSQRLRYPVKAMHCSIWPCSHALWLLERLRPDI